MRQEQPLTDTEVGEIQQRMLSELIAAVRKSNPFYQRKLGEMGGATASMRLENLPLTTRAEVQQDQIDHPPYGTNLTEEAGRYVRLHQTSGSTGIPLRWLDTAPSWDWWKRCWATIYNAAGRTPEDRVFVPFSFGPFIGFWGAFESAVAMGNFCLPAGGMSTPARLQYMVENAATMVCCTPTYALRMAEVAKQRGIDLVGSAVRALIVAGEPGGSIPATRARIESAWGARVFDHVGMTEMGPWGFECVESPGGVHVNESEFIAEVVDPESTKPVADGGVGELVLTNLGRVASPLIRYRTGDLVRLTRGRCACGRWFARADGGILGRIDDMMIIRGNNVFPSTIEGIVREFEEIAEFRLEVDETKSMTELRILVEVCEGLPGPATLLTQAIRDRLHFSPVVVVVEPGSLPRFELKANRVDRVK
jgi:phenylacetate-CoA ligase